MSEQAQMEAARLNQSAALITRIARERAWDCVTFAGLHGAMGVNHPEGFDAYLALNTIYHADVVGFLVNLDEHWFEVTRDLTEQGMRVAKVSLGPQAFAIGEEAPSPGEQRELQREATECLVLALLETFCADIRSMRDAGTCVDIVTVPYCGSDNQWRAEIAMKGKRRSLLWDAGAPRVNLYGETVAQGAWTWTT